MRYECLTRTTVRRSQRDASGPSGHRQRLILRLIPRRGDLLTCARNSCFTRSQDDLDDRAGTIFRPSTWMVTLSDELPNESQLSTDLLEQFLLAGRLRSEPAGEKGKRLALQSARHRTRIDGDLPLGEITSAHVDESQCTCSLAAAGSGSDGLGGFRNRAGDFR